MTSADYDLGYLRGGISQLEEYLLSKDLYWPPGAKPPPGGPAYPRMTLSSMLLAQARLHARSLTPEQRDQLARLDEQMDAIRNRWQVAWENKVAHEFSARLNLWRNFLQEYGEKPSQNYDRYAYEVSRRAMLELLMKEAGNLPAAERELFSGLDKLLRAVFVPGEFVWDSELERGFPSQPYWYLYGHIRES